jgi:hypothetical protein
VPFVFIIFRFDKREREGRREEEGGREVEGKREREKGKRGERELRNGIRVCLRLSLDMKKIICG